MGWFETRKTRELQIELADITEQLVTTRTQMDDFFELSRDLFMIVTVEGEIVRVNRRWTEVLGYKAEEMEGRNFKEFVVPEEAEKTQARLEENQRRNLDERGFINTYRGKDGQLVRLEWLSAKPAHGIIHASARPV